MTEEEDSVHIDHMKTHVIPIQPAGIWQSRTFLEKLLLFFAFTLLSILVLVTALAIQGWKASYIVQINHCNKETCVSPTCVQAAASVLTSMNLSVDPCQDFYQYACGGWVESNPIPDGKSTWGTFQKLGQQNQLVMKAVLERPNYAKCGAEEKAQKFYKSCMDGNDTLEKLGAGPLQDLLVKVGGWSVSSSNFSLSKWKFQTQLQVLHNDYNMGGFFTWAVGEDDRNSTRHIIQIDQGGLTLPKDYYLNNTYANVVEAYLNYMTQVGMLLGAGNETRTREMMKNVIEFETEIAKVTIASEDRRDDEKMYHAMNISSLQTLIAEVSWYEYFNNAFNRVNHTLKNGDIVVVYAPEYLGNLSKILHNKKASDEGKRVLNNYMVWHTVKSMTCCLSKAFRDAEKILRKAILGTDGTEESWRTCVGDTNNNLGFALGAMFIREAFHTESRPMAQIMIEDIRKAFQENLNNLAWMDNETRKLASEKAAATTDMIGYPDFILKPDELEKKYANLDINETDYFGNVLRVSQFTLRKNLLKLDEPVNKTKWGMTPPTVNAYYTPTSNQMVIPAGILQQPFFDPKYPKSINYGAIGVVMGHELTHGFDDQGREYDKFGNLNQWWNNETINKFKKQAECIVNQYSSFKIDGETLNGKQTLGENIADNGGLKAAFHAYRNLQTKDMYLPGVNVSHDQLFFISFAQVWCSASLKESLVLQIQNDPHVPAPLRVQGPLSNLQEFSEAFKCPIKTPMNPPKKCTVW
ncbi:unnamed protein product [Allacma fusca]|uniref:Endothelin-converting enzyme 1 n=1 Tax=Allacma fusca TaxID=39272 RepID=A0A8J2K992_9HEXA|nr:unnamed protein product [Allacma fusca]